MLDSLSVQVNTKVSGYSTMVRMSGCAEGTGHGTSKAAFWVPLSGAPCEQLLCASQHLGLWQRSAPFLKARSTLVQMAPRADADVVPMRTRARKSTAPKKPYFPPLPCGKILVGILPTTRAVFAAASLDRRTALRLRLRVVSRGRVGRCASPRMDASLARHSPSKAVSLLTRPPRCGDSQRACQQQPSPNDQIALSYVRAG